MAITFSDLRAVQLARIDRGEQTKRGWLPWAADAIGLREYSGDRGLEPYPEFTAGVDAGVARILNAYYRGEFAPATDW